MPTELHAEVLTKFKLIVIMCGVFTSWVGPTRPIQCRFTSMFDNRRLYILTPYTNVQSNLGRGRVATAGG